MVKKTEAIVKKTAVDQMQEALASVMTGAMPSGRETVQDCLVLCMFRMLDVWMTNGANTEASQAFASELDALVVALKKKEDPFIKTFGVMEQMAVFTAVNTLSKQKELMNAKPTEENTTESDSNSGDSAA